MDKEITVESLEDVIEKYQKGLDYDRKTAKITELENSEEMQYIKSKAQESGLTTQEYIKAIKEYEVKQQEAAEQREGNLAKGKLKQRSHRGAFFNKRNTWCFCRAYKSYSL